MGVRRCLARSLTSLAPVSYTHLVVIASGKCQSNLCSLAVSACSKADLDCVIIHNDEKPERAEGNQLLNSLSGADMRFIGDMPDREREKYVEQFCRELEEQNRHPYVIRNGASTALGSLGYVQAVVELCEQCAGRGIEIKHLFVPGGNGGLAAGVIFGTALVEAPFQDVYKRQGLYAYHGNYRVFCRISGSLHADCGHPVCLCGPEN